MKVSFSDLNGGEQFLYEETDTGAKMHFVKLYEVGKCGLGFPVNSVHLPDGGAYFIASDELVEVVNATDSVQSPSGR